MADCDDKDSSASTKVTFSDDIPVSSGGHSRRVELTMKYDRNTVQRRLEIERWIDTELKLLYDCTVSYSTRCYSILCTSCVSVSAFLSYY